MYVTLYEQHIESQKAAQDGTLPKILLSDGFLPFNVKRIVVFTDYDLINQAFKNPAFSIKSGPIGATRKPNSTLQRKEPSLACENISVTYSYKLGIRRRH